MPKGLQQHKAKIGEDPVGETQRQPPSRTQPERVEKILHADRKGTSGDSVGIEVHGVACCGPSDPQKLGLLGLLEEPYHGATMMLLSTTSTAWAPKQTMPTALARRLMSSAPKGSCASAACAP
jgi:hypothetical protein